MGKLSTPLDDPRIDKLVPVPAEWIGLCRASDKLGDFAAGFAEKTFESVSCLCPCKKVQVIGVVRILRDLNSMFAGGISHDFEYFRRMRPVVELEAALRA